MADGVITPLRLEADERCLLAEVEGVLERARQATSIKHAFVILALRIEDIAERYRSLAEHPSEEQVEGELLDYLQGA